MVSPTISLRDDLLQPTEEDYSKLSSVDVDANQNEGTPEKSCTLNVTHTCTPDNSVYKQVMCCHMREE